ncbi:MAG: helix-turn-helix transcriptional regulator [Proteobacteria bacterium]|nr:helix-turn-helix transcriptional regulator [Pseudomonadota bacterium]
MLLIQSNSNVSCFHATRASSIAIMEKPARRTLSDEELAAAARLSDLYESAKHASGLSQMALALACGWSSQGTVHQYIKGKIPLNADAINRFAAFFSVKPAEIYPELAEKLGMETKPHAVTIEKGISYPSEIEKILNALVRAHACGVITPEFADAQARMFQALANMGTTTQRGPQLDADGKVIMGNELGVEEAIFSRNEQPQKKVG